MYSICLILLPPYAEEGFRGGGFIVPAIAANGAEFLILILDIMDQEKETLLPDQGKARRAMVNLFKEIGETFESIPKVIFSIRLKEEYPAPIVNAVMKEFDEVWKVASQKPNNKKGWVLDWNNLKWFRIRKLTPRECFRLMDVSESDIDKMMSCGVSKSQMYRAAGNSIVVACMYYIFKQAFTENNEPHYEVGEQMSLF